MQDLDSTQYVSSRYGAMDVDSMATPHAWRALRALEREHGESVAWSTPLGRALAARVGSDTPSDPETYRKTKTTAEPVTAAPTGARGSSWRESDEPWWVYVAAWLFLLALGAWWVVVR